MTDLINMLGIEKFEIFDGALRFHILLLIIDLFFIFHFAAQYYLNYRKTGYKLDFWTIMIFLKFMIPVFLLYPFNASVYNSQYVGHMGRIDYKMDEAFLICVLGYIFVLMGRNLTFYLQSPARIINSLFAPFQSIIENNIKSRVSVNFLLLISMAFMAFVIIMQVVNGALFNPRDYFQFNGTFRPIYNATVTIFPLTMVFVGLRAIEYNLKKDKRVLILLIILSIFLGTRTAILEPLVFLLLFYTLKYSASINYRKILVIGLGFVTMLFIILHLRTQFNSNHSASSDFFRSFAYGNTFSDTRDFAWILGYWDYQFVYGSTYFAGLISFIPRSLSSYRDAWSLGVYTNNFLGFDSKMHPGLRPGSFGEVFFNFGYPGVCFLGLIIGYGLTAIDIFIKDTILKSNDVIKGYSHIFGWLIISCLCISITFSSLYTYILLNLLLLALRSVFNFYKDDNLLKAIPLTR